MTDMPAEVVADVMQGQDHSPGVVLRSVVIGLTAFLTVVDLFGRVGSRRGPGFE